MHYVHATILLSTTLKQLQQYQEVGALVDFRIQLEDRRRSLHLFLMDELKSQIFMRDKETREQYDHLDEFLSGLRNAPDMKMSLKLIDEVLNEPEEPTINPKRNVKLYLGHIIKALAVLGKLTEVVNLIGSQLRSELVLLKDKAVAGVRKTILRKLPSKLDGEGLLTANSASKELTITDEAGDDPDRVFIGNQNASPHVSFHIISQILKQYNRALRANCLMLALAQRQASKSTIATLEGDLGVPLFIAMDDAVSATSSLDGNHVDDDAISVSNFGVEDVPVVKGPQPYELPQLWLAVQSELAVVLASYLDLGRDDHSSILAAIAQNQAPDRKALLSSSSGVAAFQMDDIMAHFASKKDKDRPREPLFTFANSLNAIRDTEALVERKLETDGAGNTSVRPTDNYTRTGESAADELLCAQCVTNVYGMFKPIHLFTRDCDRVLRLGSDSGLAKFMDQYVRVRFLAHLRESVRHNFKLVTGDTGYAAEETLHELPDGRNINGSAYRVRCLIGQLVGVIYDLPVYSKQLLALIHSDTLIPYHKFCSMRFKGLARVARRSKSPLRKTDSVVAFEWIMQPEVRGPITSTPLWAKLYGARTSVVMEDDEDLPETLGAEASSLPPDVLTTVRRAMDEAHALLRLIGQHMMDKHDVTFETTPLKSMAYLLESLDWLLDYIEQLQHVFRTAPMQVDQLWGNGVTPVILHDDNVALHSMGAGLTTDIESKLKKATRDLRHLQQNCLTFLRIEVRARCLQFLLPTLKLTSYYCDAQAIETDARIVELNKTLLLIDEVLSPILSRTRREYVFEGLDTFIAEVLIYGLRWIQRYNENGIQRMQRNVFALQQFFAGMSRVRTGSLDRAMSYYKLLYLSATDVLQTIVGGGKSFTEDEYAKALELIAASAKVPGSKENTEALQDLHALFHHTV
eukprot:TRINITY_DN11101_c0_g1_i2.p1 TRINITY_DN11101_c0_g1~~TRINITY_DN11101_c0_g1_i2.p1  ORF type:complete len:975 (+),score=244.73 TRINITY_DN11101_c0_g1_i2:175-2925(+)